MGAGIIDYSLGHDNDEDCQWHVTCPTGVPTLVFNTFNTEGNFDFVNVYDGINTAATRIARLHGNAVPPLVFASGSTMSVQFTSDGFVTQDGFHGTVTCGPTPPPPPPDPACTTRGVAVGAGIIDYTLD